MGKVLNKKFDKICKDIYKKAMKICNFVDKNKMQLEGEYNSKQRKLHDRLADLSESLTEEICYLDQVEEIINETP